jgi:hypothetical protein
MNTRIKLAALVAVASLALTGCAIVLYNFVANDWRLSGDLFSIDFLTGDDSSPATPIRTREWEFSIADTVYLSIEASDMNVLLEGHDAEQTYVMTLLEGEAADESKYDVNVERDGRHGLRITARTTGDWDETAHSHAELRLNLPRRIVAKVKLYNGIMLVNSTEGSISAQVTGGSIRGQYLDGTIDLRVVEGNVELEQTRLAGRIIARSGNVTTDLNEGDLDIEATGEVSTFKQFGSLNARSHSGNIFAQILINTPACSLQSTSGTIDLNLLPGAHVDVEARAPNGTISSNLPLDSAEAPLPGHPLIGSMNRGGSKVYVSSEHGSISLRTVGE